MQPPQRGQSAVRSPANKAEPPPLPNIWAAAAAQAKADALAGSGLAVPSPLPVLLPSLPAERQGQPRSSLAPAGTRGQQSPRMSCVVQPWFSGTGSQRGLVTRVSRMTQEQTRDAV